MTSTDLDERINLKEIVDISEDEFKKQISAWIDEHGLSRKLQSKLRADLFKQFNRTKLGRQMTEQHQRAHRIVLSPLILVLNTLVAEFLYIEDCHFTVSVFANEVPYKNTLPNFENAPSRQLFRFSPSELNDIFEATGISKANEELIREFYMNVDGVSSGQEVVHKSLLYCLLKTLIAQNSRPNGGTNGGTNGRINEKIKPKTKKVKPSTSSKPVIGSTSSQQSANPSPSSHRKSSSTENTKCHSLRISSRYFKFLNRYLEILSNRINDMSKSLSEKHAGRKLRTDRHMDSSSQEESLRKDLRKIIENINKLTKSQHKSKRFQDVLNGIERLSASVEKCSEKLEDLLTAVDVQSKKIEVVEKKSNVQIDPYVNMDYADWLKGLKTSEHGRKFIDRLEISLQKTLEKERDNLEKLYEEKNNNYRMLIRLHYKQKYDANKSETVESVGKREESSPLDKITPDNTDKQLAESMAVRALEKEQQVNDIVQSAKHRLQQLERESEELDQSFQAYLRRQQMSKQQMSDDASKIWQNYTLSKTALAQFDKIEDRHNISTALQPKLTEPMNVDYVVNSTFYDDVDIQEVLKDLNEIKSLKSPRFNKNEAFSKTNSLLTFKSQRNGVKLQNNEVKSFYGRKDNQFERQTQVETRIKTSEQLKEKASNILDQLKPTEPEPPVTKNQAKPVTTVAKEKIAEPKAQLQSNEPKSSAVQQRAQTDLQNEILKTNGTAITANHTTIVKPKESIGIEKLLNSEKATQNEEINGRKSDKEINKGALTNGHSIDKQAENASIPNTKQQVAREIEKENKSLSPSKPNEIVTIIVTEEETKLEPIEKVPTTAKEDSPVKVAAVTNMTNGFAKKLSPFMPIVSDSDSAEISEQISIGQQRLIKSPDDFWI